MGAVLSRPARGVTGRVGAARCSGAPGTAKRGAGRDVDQMPWAAASSRWLRRSAVDIAIAVHSTPMNKKWRRQKERKPHTTPALRHSLEAACSVGHVKCACVSLFQPNVGVNDLPSARDPPKHGGLPAYDGPERAPNEAHLLLSRVLIGWHVALPLGTATAVFACACVRLQLQPQLSAPMGLEALLPATCVRFARESVPGAIPARVRGIGTVCATS